MSNSDNVWTYDDEEKFRSWFIRMAKKHKMPLNPDDKSYLNIANWRTVYKANNPDRFSNRKNSGYFGA